MEKQTPICDFGWPAPDFDLPATDNKNYSLTDVKGANGTLIIFMCNHCPYVRSILDRINRDARDLQDLGIGIAAISANDAQNYPADGFEEMQKLAQKENFPFPYLYDESQEIARSYGAACTPDFFGFDSNTGLQYRGRLDASRQQAGPTDLRRDLFEAMKQVAQTSQGPTSQIPSIGCSIKWK